MPDPRSMALAISCVLVTWKWFSSLASMKAKDDLAHDPNCPLALLQQINSAKESEGTLAMRAPECCGILNPDLVYQGVTLCVGTPTAANIYFIPASCYGISYVISTAWLWYYIFWIESELSSFSVLNIRIQCRTVFLQAVVSKPYNHACGLGCPLLMSPWWS